MALVEIDRVNIAVIATVTAPVGPVGFISAIAYWNPDTGIWENQSPNILVGQKAGVMGYATNSSKKAVTIRMDATITIPSGGTFGFQGKEREMAAGATETWAFDFDVLYEGVYGADLVLYAVT